MNPSTAATKRRDGKPAVQDPPALFTQRFVLHDISCAAYEAILAALPERRLRHTYNKGRLEMVSPSLLHESIKRLIGRLLEAMSLELDVPIRSVSATTLHPEGEDRGLEGDEAYYIAHEAAMRARDTIDLSHDPPPDLVVEVDVASSSRERLPLYAGMGVPEIWLHDGRSLQFLGRSEAGEYKAIDASLAFPLVRPADVQRFVAQLYQVDENSIIKEFLAWLDSQRSG